jgi:dihydroxyacetone kinase-like protein
MIVLTTEQVMGWLQRAAGVLKENRDFLTGLDAALGDADHGVNMNRGFTRVVEMLGTLDAPDMGSVLKKVGMTLISSVGGASGPLYGTFFMRAAEAAAGGECLDSGGLVNMLISGTQGVMERGRARPGEKTMVDALHAASRAAEEALQQGLELKDIAGRAAEGARRGVEETVAMQARKGRASYLGERSLGHQDPGATSSYFILQALYDTIAASSAEDAPDTAAS